MRRGKPGAPDKSDRKGREHMVAGLLLNSTLLTSLLRFLLDSRRLNQEEIAVIFGGASALLDANAARVPEGVMAAAMEGLIDIGSHFGLSPERH